MSIVRISRGTFEPGRFAEIKRLVEESAGVLAPAIKRLCGLLYYHAAVDEVTSTVVNVSVWDDMEAANQMSTLSEMLAQRPILESAGVVFDKIVNYEPIWKIGLDE